MKIEELILKIIGAEYHIEKTIELNFGYCPSNDFNFDKEKLELDLLWDELEQKDRQLFNFLNDKFY